MSHSRRELVLRQSPERPVPHLVLAALGGAFAHHGERVPHPRQRLQAEQDRRRVDQDHARAEQQQGERQPPAETGDLGLELAMVAHDAEARDPVLRIETRAELTLLHRRLGATMVYVTHDQEEAMTLGSRIAVMRDGRLE